MTTIPTPRTTDQAALRLGLQLVAGVFAAPGDGLRDDLASGAFAQATGTLADMTGVPGPTVEPPAWTDLQASHVDLFVSSGRGVAAPPYVGYAVDDELLGPTARTLKAFYDRHGITPNAAWGDLPDHVAAVAEAGVLLVEAGRGEAARTLLARFIAPWLDRYAAAVVTRDTSGFYGPMTRFLHAAIEEVTRESSTAES